MRVKKNQEWVRRLGKIFTCSLFLLLPGKVQLAGAEAVSYPKKISLAAIKGLPEYEGPATQILKQAYGQLGIEIDVQALPAVRALKLARSGEKDGDLGRLKLPDKEAENLFMIPIPIGFAQLAVYCRKELKTTFPDWEAMRRAKLTVGKIRGGAAAGKELDNFVIFETNDYQSLVMMLHHRRIDLIVAPNIVIQNLVKAMREKIEGLDQIEEHHNLEALPIYHYVNEKHKQLVEPLTAVLKKMEANGTIASFWKKK